MTINLTLEKVFASLKDWRAYSVLNDIFEECIDLDVYLAGGSIRNIIFGNQDVKDYDFFIGGGYKDKIIKYLSNYGRIDYGPFGSPRWYPENETEIYCDLIWIPEFYNGLWKCRDIVDVINQFDFTANAIAINLKTAKLFNHQNGISDIDNKIMRAVRFDYPNEVISNKTDLGRLEILWFRLLHYANKYSMRIEPITMEWLDENKIFINKKKEFSDAFFEPLI